ncbi:MAG TPA: YbaK/EbsC family protein [Acidimicrobiales bacterium]|jgi:prolyl-tRNA editing enzyme YbaK/EbsC (Cys-tRNA(Pro) deacylase)
MTAGLPASVAAVVAAGRERDVAVDVREFPEGTRTADDAARAVGVEVGQIVKSLAFLVDGRPVMALVSGSNRLDEARLAAAAGGTEVLRAGAEAVRRATGFAIGGVPPFGHASSMPTFVDEDLLHYDVVWAAAGTPRHVFPIAPGELVRAAGGTVCRLS